MNIRPFITPIVVLIVAGYVMFHSIKALGGTYMEDTWKVTTGTILSPDLKLEGKDNIRRKTEGFEQVINYEYEVEGKMYRSNSVAREAVVNLTDYPEGKVVNVYYNPFDVTDSVLVRSVLQKQFIYMVILFCAVMIGLVVYFFIRDLRSG